ncbi:HAD family hydrolase [Enterococcus rivorum]|uniref:HAD family hydrolase n=1 Tax=Enterococcus rivorum TaxID=762845 RepID=A0A1E5KZS1_9ENTE|nr:HAD family hydrolase [Enterococcus rivorum]MBP2099260.1 putative hydrolase of the HAD superfamily [Enterococcus rivorum]OEH83360.1 HAD family hydrolase [Enterococcus rivorum]
MNTIVFDVDDTIYDQQQPFLNAVLRIFPEVKESDIHPLYIRFRFHSDETFSKVVSNEWSINYMRTYRINESLKDLGYSEPSEMQSTLFQQIYEDELDNIVMHPEVKRLLDYLKEKNIPIGIITNGPTDHQYKKVKQLNLENWVPTDNIIISQSTGYQKPDKEIFYLAAKQFKMEPDKTLYVGDSFENDVAGAYNGGWHSVWFNHRLRSLPEKEEATHLFEIQSFDTLFETITKIFK